MDVVQTEVDEVRVEVLGRFRVLVGAREIAAGTARAGR
jgi:hypothetical protein